MTPESAHGSCLKQTKSDRQTGWGGGEQTHLPHAQSPLLQYPLHDATCARLYCHHYTGYPQANQGNQGGKVMHGNSHAG